MRSTGADADESPSRGTRHEAGRRDAVGHAARAPIMKSAAPGAWKLPATIRPAAVVGERRVQQRPGNGGRLVVETELEPTRGEPRGEGRLLHLPPRLPMPRELVGARASRIAKREAAAAPDSALQ